jgi:hypothetical protein
LIAYLQIIFYIVVITLVEHPKKLVSLAVGLSAWAITTFGPQGVGSSCFLCPETTRAVGWFTFYNEVREQNYHERYNCMTIEKWADQRTYC